jgi:hypothetical protein
LTAYTKQIDATNSPTCDHLDDHHDPDRPPEQVLEDVGVVGSTSGDGAEAPHHTCTNAEERSDHWEALSRGVIHGNPRVPNVCW